MLCFYVPKSSIKSILIVLSSLCYLFVNEILKIDNGRNSKFFWVQWIWKIEYLLDCWSIMSSTFIKKKNCSNQSICFSSDTVFFSFIYLFFLLMILIPSQLERADKSWITIYLNHSLHSSISFSIIISIQYLIVILWFSAFEFHFENGLFMSESKLTSINT